MKATQAMHQIPSRPISMSDFSEDENEEDNSQGDMGMKTTPKNSVAGKGKGKRRTSVVQSGIELQKTQDVRPRLQSIEPRTPDEYSLADSMDDKAPSFKQPWTDEEQVRLISIKHT